MEDCCEAQIFGKGYHTLNCKKGIEELQKKREEEEDNEPCSYCGYCPCKCVEINNQVDEFRDGSAYYIN